MILSLTEMNIYIYIYFHLINILEANSSLFTKINVKSLIDDNDRHTLIRVAQSRIKVFSEERISLKVITFQNAIAKTTVNSSHLHLWFSFDFSFDYFWAMLIFSAFFKIISAFTLFVLILH